MTDVTPRWKVYDKPKKRRKGLAAVGKKGEKDRTDLSATRPIVAGRARGRCEARLSANCHGEGDQQHHVKRRSQGGTNDPSNLLWICSICHLEIHAEPDEARALGLLKRSTDE